jgi:hypothetical protein
VAVQGIDIDTAEPRNGEKLRLEDLRRRDGSDNVRRNGSNLCNVFRPIDRLWPDAGNCFLHSSRSIIAAIASAHVGFVSSIRRKNETSVILITANSRRCVHEGVYLYSGMPRKCGARLAHAAFCTSMRPSHTVCSLSQACRITAFSLSSRSGNTCWPAVSTVPTCASCDRCHRVRSVGSLSQMERRYPLLGIASTNPAL